MLIKIRLARLPDRNARRYDLTVMTRQSLRIAATMAGLTCFVLTLGGVPVIARQAALRALDSNHPITYFIADGSGKPGYRSSDRELALWALQAWKKTIGGTLQLDAAPESTALVRIYWASPQAGEFGEMQPLTVGGRRGAAVFIRPDVESLGPDIARNAESDALLRDSIVYLTCLHELGHAFGLAHTQDFRDIMYYFGYGGDVLEYFGRYRARLRSRNDIATVAGLSDGDVSRVRALYTRR